MFTLSVCNVGEFCVFDLFTAFCSASLRTDFGIVTEYFSRLDVFLIGDLIFEVFLKVGVCTSRCAIFRLANGVFARRGCNIVLVMRSLKVIPIVSLTYLCCCMSAFSYVGDSVTIDSLIELVTEMVRVSLVADDSASPSLS